MQGLTDTGKENCIFLDKQESILDTKYLRASAASQWEGKGRGRRLVCYRFPSLLVPRLAGLNVYICNRQRISEISRDKYNNWVDVLNTNGAVLGSSESKTGDLRSN
jgi:hypothetical protein